MHTNKYILLLVTAAMLCLSGALNAAVTFGFGWNAGNAQAVTQPIGEAQLFVTVEAYTGGGTSFTFFNTGSELSYIAGIHIHDQATDPLTLPYIAGTDPEIFNSVAGYTNFVLAPHPKGTFPSGNDATPPFVSNLEIATSGDRPNSTDGVSPGDSLMLLFDQADYGTVLSAMGNGTLRFGLQVQGISDNGYSAQFINNPMPVPAPGAIVLAGIGTTLVGWLRRRRSL